MTAVRGGRGAGDWMKEGERISRRITCVIHIDNSVVMARGKGRGGRWVESGKAGWGIGDICISVNIKNTGEKRMEK